MSVFVPNWVFLTCKICVSVPPAFAIELPLGGFIDSSMNFGTAVWKEKLLKSLPEKFSNVHIISDFDGSDGSSLLRTMVSFKPPFSNA